MEKNTYGPEYVAWSCTLKISLAASVILCRTAFRWKGNRFWKIIVRKEIICSMVGGGWIDWLIEGSVDGGTRRGTARKLESGSGSGRPLHLYEKVGCCSLHWLHFGGFARLVQAFVVWFPVQYPHLGWFLHSSVEWSLYIWHFSHRKGNGGCVRDGSTLCRRL